MENVELKKSGNKLTIIVDLSKEGKPSYSGKSIVIASTQGNVALPDDPTTIVGLNVYKRKAKV